MAYKKTDMIKQCLEAIQENNLVFIEDIIAYVYRPDATRFNRHKKSLLSYLLIPNSAF